MVNQIIPRTLKKELLHLKNPKKINFILIYDVLDVFFILLNFYLTSLLILDISPL